LDSKFGEKPCFSPLSFQKLANRRFAPLYSASIKPIQALTVTFSVYQVGSVIYLSRRRLTPSSTALPNVQHPNRMMPKTINPKIRSNFSLQGYDCQAHNLTVEVFHSVNVLFVLVLCSSPKKRQFFNGLQRLWLLIEIRLATN
jgi:hypothetical protein